MKIQINSEYDHENTSKVICPFCGFICENEDKEIDEECQCPDCRKVFEYRKYGERYSSFKNEDEDDFEQEEY